MGKSAGSAPQAPDPVVTAKAQGDINKETAEETARLNRVNQYTPYGNLVYSETPGADVYDEEAYQKAMEDYLKSYRPASDNEAEGYSLPKPVMSDYMKKGDPIYNATMTLSPEQMELLRKNNLISNSLADTATEQLGRVKNALGQELNFEDSIPIDYSGNVTSNVDMSKVPSLVGGDALAKMMYDAGDAAYKSQTGYLDPQWKDTENDLETKLANQGVMQNSEAYNKARSQMGREKEFAYSQARNEAFNQGLASQNQLYNQGLQSNQNAFSQGLSNANLNNQALAQRLNSSIAARRQQNEEKALLRNQPINDLSALLSGSQVSTPSFSNVPQVNVNPVDYTGMMNNQYNNQMSQYNAKVGSQNSMMSGLFGLGSAALRFLPWSDRRLKKNIKKIGKTPGGNNLYSFDYIWDEPGIGVMADEVMHIPGAVLEHESGYKMVDYSKVT